MHPQTLIVLLLAVACLLAVPLTARADGITLNFSTLPSAQVENYWNDPSCSGNCPESAFYSVGGGF